MTRRALVDALCAHPGAHLRELRPGVWALAVRDGVRWRVVAGPWRLGPGDVLTARARVAMVRDALLGAWVETDAGPVRQTSLADYAAVEAWADGRGSLAVHPRP